MVRKKHAARPHKHASKKQLRGYALWALAAILALIFIATFSINPTFHTITPVGDKTGERVFWAYADPNQAQVLLASDSATACSFAATNKPLAKPFAEATRTIQNAMYYPIGVVYGPQKGSSMVTCTSDAPLAFYRAVLTSSHLVIIRALTIIGLILLATFTLRPHVHRRALKAK